MTEKKKEKKCVTVSMDPGSDLQMYLDILLGISRTLEPPKAHKVFSTATDTTLRCFY